MEKKTIQEKIERLLSKEYYCTLEELNQKGNLYPINTDAKKPYIKILAYKNCIAICTSKNLHEKAKELLQDKNRDEIFELPYVYGQTIHYVPAGEYAGAIPALPNYSCESLFDGDISILEGLKGFENSLGFDGDGYTPTRAVCIVRDGGKIAGIAGAAGTSVDGLWEMGVDVAEENRNAGLGTYLVKNLTRELLARGIIPFYSASVTNIGSQMVAHRCGYIPMWVDTFGTTLDGSSVYNGIVQKMAGYTIFDG
ncbi:MAG: GNAT family N-acetyltransferase [Clostridium sp.]|nr:GNAT family N-acetyltransferase [Clostridium sp.]